MTRILLATLLMLTQSCLAHGKPIFFDPFDDVEAWRASGSDGVASRLSNESVSNEGVQRSTIRVDVEFLRGSGFAVFRRDVAIDLPENWVLAFDVFGELPLNNFEVKLIDDTGENVWWVNQRNFVFAPEWTTPALKKRRFSFAWGPGGAQKPLKRLSAIEFAVTAGSGGKGTVWLDSLRIDESPVSTEGPVNVKVSSSAPGREPPEVLPADGVINWMSAPEDNAPRIELDFGGPREIGGLTIDWGTRSPRYSVARRIPGEDGLFVLAFDATKGGTHHISLPYADATSVILWWEPSKTEEAILLNRIQVRDVSFSTSTNALISVVASESPRGLYPRAFVGEQVYWTVIGAPDAEHEALMSEDGAIELFEGGPTIEPFLILNDRLITWNDAQITQRLEEASPFPKPVVEWRVGDIILTIHASATPDGATRGEYELHNAGAEQLTGRFSLTLRPFQVLPPTQDLNLTGGWTRLSGIGAERDRWLSSAKRPIELNPAGWTMHASTFMEGGAVAWLASGAIEPKKMAMDNSGLASGAALREFVLAADARVVYGFTASPPRQITKTSDGSVDLVNDADENPLLDRVSFSLPPHAQRYVDTFRSQIAYILINRDGPAIQPGSRSYDRTWIRDGALTSTALLYAGYPDEVRLFLDWFAPFQYEDGKVPCCADERGPDPVPEHDSHGQYIYAVAEYDRFMRDEAFLRSHVGRVSKAVDYIESLRAQRMTDAYKNGEGIERAKYGLVPESISHEGYSAKPMHSYWDDFWVLRGLQDAAYIGGRVGDDGLEARAAAAAASMRECLYDSMRLAMKIKGIDYIPGCVELGDFDATSTSIGVFPVGEIGRIPEPQLANTFERYVRWFDDRASGRMEWKDYTPYEIRNTTTFLLLGRRDVTHRMMDFFFKDQRPAGWNAWAEVVRNGYRTPGFLGDIPHTWVGSDFVKLLRTMFVHERDDGALVVGLGITKEWIEGGAGASRLPTHYGELSVEFEMRDGARVVTMSGALREAPPGGVEIALEDLEGAEIAVDGKRVELNEAGRLVVGWPVGEVVLRKGEQK